jgi:hypothetical protein
MSLTSTETDNPGGGSPDPPKRSDGGKVRWRRFTAMFVASATVAGVLIALTAQGVLAAQFAISGMPFTVTATELHGTGFEQYAVLDNMAGGADNPNAGNSGGQLVLVVSAINSADLTNLCQSIDLGGAFLVIRAGTGAQKVHADTLIVDSDQLSGNATFTSINIGQDASTLDAVSGAPPQPLGLFSQQAATVVITNLRQRNYATTAATFTLPNLNLGFSSTGC